MTSPLGADYNSMNQPLVKIGTEFVISGHIVEVTKISKDEITANLHDDKGAREITLDLDKVAEAVIQHEKTT